MDENEKLPAPSAVCRFEFTDEDLKEGYSYLRKPLTIFYSVISAVSAVMLVIMLILNQVALAIYLGVIIVVCVAMLVLFAPKRIKKQIAAFKEMNGNALNLDFYEDFLTATNVRGFSRYEYSKFCKATELNFLWIIYLGDVKSPSAIMFIPKDGFSDANGYDFFMKRLIGQIDPKYVKRLRKPQ